MPLEELMQVAGEGIGALLDGTDRPVDATLRCKDRTGKAFRLPALRRVRVGAVRAGGRDCVCKRTDALAALPYGGR